MRPHILTSGTAAEYSVGGVAAHLRTAGWNVTELDFGSYAGDPRPLLEKLATEPVVFLTSGHVHLSNQVAAAVVPVTVRQYPCALSPLEIMALVETIASLYIPHDLSSPFGESALGEARFLSQFTHVLAPSNPMPLQAALGPGTTVLDAGWVKYTTDLAEHAAQPPKDPPAVALFMTFINHMLLRFGPEGIAEYLRPLAGPNTTVKLPAWHGADAVTALLRESLDVEIAEPDVPSTALIMRSDVVVCNATSSIHTEAALLGRPVVAVDDGLFIYSADQRAALAHLPNLTFHDYCDRTPIASDALAEIARNKTTPLLQPFDYARVETLIASLG